MSNYELVQAALPIEQCGGQIQGALFGDLFDTPEPRYVVVESDPKSGFWLILDTVTGEHLDFDPDGTTMGRWKNRVVVTAAELNANHNR